MVWGFDADKFDNGDRAIKKFLVGAQSPILTMPVESSSPSQSAEIFKGIALFTPAGDLVYCIDPKKQNRWHLQLCSVLQEMLGLPEPPHFLVPCYTATIDHWLNPQTQKIETFAEAGPPVLRYQAFLNAIFGAQNLAWKAIAGMDEVCDPFVLLSYREQFPQLWEEHDLVVRLNDTMQGLLQSQSSTLAWTPTPARRTAQGYVLRLFVAGNTVATGVTLQTLHQALEQCLREPYTLKVVDIHKHPDLAEADQIAATPTLVKVWPHPVRRLVGELNDINRLAQMLSSSNGFENDIEQSSKVAEHYPSEHR